jgi:hypothetical protein
MKRVLLVGGPCDGQVKSVDNGLTVLYARKPRPFNTFEDGSRKVKPAFNPDETQRYVEVVFGEQKPLSIFKLDTLQDDDVLHKLAHFYADRHETPLIEI